MAADFTLEEYGSEFLFLSLSLHIVQTRSGAHLAFYLRIIRVSFPGCKAAGT
jgi:hypothetical protein